MEVNTEPGCATFIKPEIQTMFSHNYCIVCRRRHYCQSSSSLLSVIIIVILIFIIMIIITLICNLISSSKWYSQEHKKAIHVAKLVISLMRSYIHVVKTYSVYICSYCGIMHLTTNWCWNNCTKCDIIRRRDYKSQEKLDLFLLNVWLKTWAFCYQPLSNVQR